MEQLGTTCTIFSYILASICYKDLPIFLLHFLYRPHKKEPPEPRPLKKMLCMPLCFSEFQILSLMKNCFYFDLCVGIYVRTRVTTIHCRCIRQTGGAKVHLQDVLLENLLPNCKVLNINTPKKQKVPKETNWKQKFQKPQNENICLTYLNT
ncbi:MAG: hypothetical protein PUC16_00385, partial [Bacteroidales bacterium]|nr:hypothetical protein [Bacteroidales bacterium]